MSKSYFINSGSVIRVVRALLLVCVLSAAVWIIGCKSKEASGEFFVQKGCVQCHSVSSFDLKAQAETGPDLTYAVEDAPRRFGKSLDMFWMNPTGTMQMVLDSQIKLTPEEKNEALDLLKIAYERRKK